MFYNVSYLSNPIKDLFIFLILRMPANTDSYVSYLLKIVKRMKSVFIYFILIQSNTKPISFHFKITAPYNSCLFNLIEVSFSLKKNPIPLQCFMFIKSNVKLLLFLPIYDKCFMCFHSFFFNLNQYIFLKSCFLCYLIVHSTTKLIYFPCKIMITVMAASYVSYWFNLIEVSFLFYKPMQFQCFISIYTMENLWYLFNTYNACYDCFLCFIFV